MSQFISRENYPVVDTDAGKLRGYVWNDTFTFKGIKYADAERFHRPRKVQKWEGVKDACSYGYVCPLLNQEKPANEHLVPHMYWPMDEHCQYLNIWTQSLDADAKKPVMVWLHGGGFFAGSSIEQLAYDGENMSRYGDVVVVSLNHRLNVLGYLDLSPFGEEYKDTANLGNFDIIAALSWIRDNIAAFGGDPENVTIFGQSGGGAKVWTLMQMPEADGLFHKGIIQSGVYKMIDDVEDHDGRQIVEAMMKRLGLDPESPQDVKQLESVPYARLAEAYRLSAPEVREQGGYVGNEPHLGDSYFGTPMKHGFRDHAKKIPLMIGTVLGEFDFLPPVSGRAQMKKEQIRELVSRRYGSEGPKLLELFRRAYPDKHPLDVLAVDTLFRPATLEMIRERAKSQEAPTWSYQFTYTFPLFEGKLAWHCSEIPFVFHNIDKVPICNNGPESEILQDRIFGAWISFAKTGKPEIKGLEWPACSEEEEPVMILDTVCEVRRNVDHELLPLAEKSLHPDFAAQGEIQH